MGPAETKWQYMMGKWHLFMTLIEIESSNNKDSRLELMFTWLQTHKTKEENWNRTKTKETEAVKSIRSGQKKGRWWFENWTWPKQPGIYIRTKPACLYTGLDIDFPGIFSVTLPLKHSSIIIILASLHVLRTCNEVFLFFLFLFYSVIILRI